MVVARVAMRMEVRHIFVFMEMAMNKIVGFQEDEIFQDLLCFSVPDLFFIFSHHH